MASGKRALALLLTVIALVLSGCALFSGSERIAGGYVEYVNVEETLGRNWKEKHDDPAARSRFLQNLGLDDDLMRELGNMEHTIVYEQRGSVFVAEENGLLILEFRNGELVEGRVNIVYETNAIFNDPIYDMFFSIEGSTNASIWFFDENLAMHPAPGPWDPVEWTMMVKNAEVTRSSLEALMHSGEVWLVTRSSIYGEYGYEAETLCRGTLRLLRLMGKQETREKMMVDNMEMHMDQLFGVIHWPAYRSLENGVHEDIVLAGTGEEFAFRSELFEMKLLKEKPEISLLADIPLSEREGSAVVLKSSDGLWYVLTVGKEDMTEKDGMLHAAIPLDDELISIFGKGNVTIWQGEGAYESNYGTTEALSSGDKRLYEVWQGVER